MHLIRKNNVTFCNKKVTIEDEFTLDPSKVTCRDCILGRINENSGERERIIKYCYVTYRVPKNIDYFKRTKFRDIKAMDALIENYNLIEIYGLSKPRNPLSE